MTEELKQAAQQVVEAWEASGRYPDSTSDIERLDSAIDTLRAAISQAQGGKAGEAVAWFEYSEQRGEWFLAYTKNPRAKTRPLVYGDTHPAPGVPDGVVRDAERFRRLDLTEAAIAAVDAMLTSAQAQKVQP